MTQLPLIPSITCRHHASTPFPPPPERFREPTTAEQEQYFRDIALWLLQHDERVRDPMEELQNPNYSKLLDAIRDKHYIYSRILRFNGDDLQHGVSTGCSFCRTIIEGFHKLYGDRQFWTEYFVSFDFGDGIACLEMFKLSDKYFNDSDDIDDSDDSDDSTLWIEMLEFPLLSKREFSVWVPSRQSHLLHRSSSLEAVLNMTRAWLHTCAKEHINCAQSTSSFIPTRVLEIRSNETAKKVRLIEPRDPLSSYAALSYCWGVAEQPGWLTNAVLQQYKQGIDVFSLPQTIQDAIIVAEGLEIPHLWIDALCIIQDSSADKNHEIDQMGRIFENATITIEASRASVVNEGFLNFDTTIYQHDALWVLEMGGNVNLELRRRQSTESDKIILAGHLAGQESSVFAEHQEPLSNRGWTFQEHLLARRTISFRATEITWACLNDTDVSSFRERYKPLSRRSTSIQFNTDREFWTSGWANLINDFTKRTLRYPRDRLPALAGIAQRWADGLNDVYVAGLWRSSLPLTLLWYVRDCEPALGINDKLPAPSWSWAAVSKPVHLQSEPGNVLCAECLEVDITRGSSDSVFGAVAEGVLKLRGILTPVSLTHSPQHSGGYIVFINDDGSGDYQIRTCLAMLDRDVDVETEGLFVLAIAKALDLRGLLVLKNPDGTFSRLGFVMTTGTCRAGLLEEKT